jgi:hypothetical protein
MILRVLRSAAAAYTLYGLPGAGPLPGSGHCDYFHKPFRYSKLL